MAKHIFYFPSAYAAVIHSFIGCLGLLFPLYIGVILHPVELLTTHCGPHHYEYWPSISTTIGDMMPERQIWRTALLIAFPFRVVASLSVFYVFWSKGSAGLLDLNRFALKPLSLMRTTAFMVAALLFFDLSRWIAAFTWTMVVSAEIHDVHNFGFLCYIFLSIGYHVSCTILTWKNRRNSVLYNSTRDAMLSFNLKMLCLVGQFVASMCVIIFYIRHQATCADGSYSLANMFEWSFALFNLSFDATMWFELQNEGIWLSGSPSFYQTLWQGHSSSKNDGSTSAPPHSSATLEEKAPYVDVDIDNSSRCTSSSPWYISSLFPGKDISVYIFTIASPPSDTLMWICDTFWAYQYFGGMMHCIQHMYFQPLVAMSVTWEVVAGLANFSPVLLVFPQVRRILCGRVPFFKKFLCPPSANAPFTPMYVLFYLLVAFAPLQQLVTQSPRRKIVSTGFGPFFLYLAFSARFLYPTYLRREKEEMQECRRLCYTLPLGLAFSMILRILHLSHDPLYVDPFYGSVFGIGLGLFFTLTVYRNATFHGPRVTQQGPTDDTEETHLQENEIEEMNTYAGAVNGYRPISQAWLGLLNGALYIFSLMFLTSANILPRFLAVEPMPGGIFVVFSFLCGLIFSPSILPLCSRVLEGSKGRGIRALVTLKIPFSASALYFVVCFLASTLVMLYGTRQSNFAYTNKQYSYHQPNVTVTDWKVQEDFSGSKHLSFFAGLCMIFCAGVLYPVAMELTWVQKRYRHVLRVNVEKRTSIIPQIQSPFTFEVVTFMTYFFFVLAFALCMCYPFVPGGELFRQRTRQFILLLVVTLSFVVLVCLVRTRDAKISCQATTAYIQRCMPLRMVVLVVFVFLIALGSRSFRQPQNVGYPVGDPEFAAKYQPYILCVQDRFIDIRRMKNGATDGAIGNRKQNAIRQDARDREFWLERDLERDGCYSHPSVNGDLPPLNAEERKRVVQVGKALYEFSGLIWTIHFALDNKNTDSLWRLVQVMKSTEASVIGILESDSSHIHNGNRDLAEYLSYYLGFPYVDNGPAPLDDTFGCAMISKYPILKVRRYIMPSPLGELACLIHATLDVMGVRVETYVGHFGNTEHDADGLLQSQFLGQLVKKNPGPSMWLGYVVSYPGNPVRYGEYSSPNKRGYLRDSAHFLYTKTPWVRLWERGGYDEEPPAPRVFREEEKTDFNVEAKIPVAAFLEEGMKIDESFRRTPYGKPLRTFYYNNTNRYAHAHPRFEFLDRYCQYCFFKTGQPEDELEEFSDKLQPYAAELFDWERIVDDTRVTSLSDTETQVIQLRFVKRNPS